MGGMPLNDMPWWRWRSNVRSALHMLSDPAFQQEAWLAGRPGYGDVTDAVYRLVEDTWLDNWSAEKYVGTIFRDSAGGRSSSMSPCCGCCGSCTRSARTPR